MNIIEITTLNQTFILLKQNSSSGDDKNEHQKQRVGVEIKALFSHGFSTLKSVDLFKIKMQILIVF